MLRAFVSGNVQPPATDLPRRRFITLLLAAGHLPSGGKISETAQRGAAEAEAASEAKRETASPKRDSPSCSLFVCASEESACS